MQYPITTRKQYLETSMLKMEKIMEKRMVKFAKGRDLAVTGT
jgi:hypothetical protein